MEKVPPRSIIGWRQVVRPRAKWLKAPAPPAKSSPTPAPSTPGGAAGERWEGEGGQVT